MSGCNTQKVVHGQCQRVVVAPRQLSSPPPSPLYSGTRSPPCGSLCLDSCQSSACREITARTATAARTVTPAVYPDVFNRVYPVQSWTRCKAMRTTLSSTATRPPTSGSTPPLSPATTTAGCRTWRFRRAHTDTEVVEPRRNWRRWPIRSIVVISRRCSSSHSAPQTSPVVLGHPVSAWSAAVSEHRGRRFLALLHHGKWAGDHRRAQQLLARAGVQVARRGDPSKRLSACVGRLSQGRRSTRLRRAR